MTWIGYGGWHNTREFVLIPLLPLGTRPDPRLTPHVAVDKLGHISGVRKEKLLGQDGFHRARIYKGGWKRIAGTDAGRGAAHTLFTCVVIGLVLRTLDDVQFALVVTQQIFSRIGWMLKLGDPSQKIFFCAYIAISPML